MEHNESNTHEENTARIEYFLKRLGEYLDSDPKINSYLIHRYTRKNMNSIEVYANASVVNTIMAHFKVNDDNESN